MKERTKGQGLPLLGLAFLLAGCGSDRSVITSGQSVAHPPAATAPVNSVFTPAASQPAATSAPPADPLTASTADSITPTSDPLIGNAGGPESDPLAGGDPLKGQKMPTKHTHWLCGQVRSGHVSVSLNGIHLGDISGFVDRDITMRLRAGINTVTFAYFPQSGQSSAKLDLIAGEYEPPIAPLATFDTAAGNGLSLSETAKPQTKTVTFTAL